MTYQKRIFDLALSVPGLILISPLLIVITIFIWVTDGQPILFRQERVGYRGRRFYILKFRTMVRNAEKVGGQITIGRDQRITRLGWWLRKSKLDELPQLFNVVKGEMSLVGPRPEVPQYVQCYTEDQAQVLELVPGITDPASVLYVNEASILGECDNPEEEYINRIMPEKIRVNLEYAGTAGLLSDIRVLLATVGAIVKTPSSFRH